MIIFSIFPLIFFLRTKKFFCLNELFLFIDMTIIVISIIFLVLCVLFRFYFSTLDIYSVISFKVLFILILLFINFSFSSERSYYFLFFFELSAFFIIYLIINLSYDSDKLYARIFMIVINLIGSLPFIIFCSFSIKILGSTSISNYLYNRTFSYSSFYLFFFSFLIFLFKLPLFFFHFWLPKAHVRASGSCSIVLASLILKLGGFGLFKFFPFFIFLTSTCSLIFNVFMCISFVYLGLSIIRYSDLKSLIAVSSVMHITPLVFLVSNYSEERVNCSYLFITSHGVISRALFFIVTILYEQSNTRSFILLKGSDKICKRFFFFFVFWLIINFGFPPFSNFLGEFMLGVCCFYKSIYSIVFFGCYILVCNIIFMFFCTKILSHKRDRIFISNINIIIIYLNFIMGIPLIFCAWMI